ncbi:MAG: hypothetical protein NT062_26755 [Proteobacteria bacterium]|nr:hypothetical protein [Pseudomonadota bacterium]
MTRGAYEELEGNWAGTSAATASDRIYAVTNGALFALDGERDTWEQLAGTWDTVALVACGPALLAFERSGALYRVAAADGTWEELDGTYVELKAATSTNGVAYVVEGVNLYRVALDGTYTQLDGSWDPVQMTAIDDALFVFERGGSLYRVSAETGTWEELDGTWANTTAACAHLGRLYVVDGGELYDVDPATGAWEAINSGWTTKQLVSCGAHLFAFEASGSLFRISV